MVDTFIADVSIFISYFGGFVLYIRVGGWSTYSVILLLFLLLLCEDSSPTILTEDSFLTLWIRPLFSLLWFYPLSQGRFVYSDYRRLVSIVLVWIRPLLLIKPGFMAVINFYV